MKITTVFKDSVDSPVEGLFPKLTIRNITDIDNVSLELSSGEMVDIESGFYAYEFEDFSDKKDYSIFIDADTDMSNRYQYGTIDKFTLETEIEDDLGIRDMLKLFMAVLANKSSGGGTNIITFRDKEDTKNRITASVDDNGNRLAVTINTE